MHNAAGKSLRLRSAKKVQPWPALFIYTSCSIFPSNTERIEVQMKDFKILVSRCGPMLAALPYMCLAGRFGMLLCWLTSASVCRSDVTWRMDTYCLWLSMDSGNTGLFLHSHHIAKPVKIIAPKIYNNIIHHMRHQPYMYIFSKNKYALVTAIRHPQVVAFDPFPAVRGVWFTWIPV